MLPDGLPGLSLGWDLLDWGGEYLAQPDGVNAGDTWVYSSEQARFIVWFYGLDESGRYIYRRALIQRAKGWGKSPLLAALCSTELCGPVVFDGFDADGQPVGRPHPNPHVQLAALSAAQARNTMSLIIEMVGQGTAVDEYGLDVGLTRIRRGSGLLEPVTAAAKSREGERPTFIVMDEALSLDTLVPTTTGWRMVGALTGSDMLFGSDGTPTRILGFTPVQRDRKCYRLTFKDGSSVVASDGHLWWSKFRGGCQPPMIRTTERMARAKMGFMVPLAAPRWAPERELPIDPYVFGLWLGDGDKTDGRITAHDDDIDHVRVATGGRIRRYSDKAGHVHIAGLRGKLRLLGVLRNKHIPSTYLSGSVDQRVALLQGLMDSDGWCCGSCTFSNSDKSIIDGFCELLGSLGIPHGVTFQADQRSRVGGCYRINFTSRHGIIPFRLPRKAMKVNGGQRWMTVTSIEEVESVPVRCIAVEASDHLFSLGSVMTHNTHHWADANHGKDLAATLRRNLAKVGGRSVETTNAFKPGDSSVAEDSWEYWRKIETGQLVDGSFLYDCRQAPEDTPLEPGPARRAGLIAAYGDSAAENGGWVDLDRIEQEIDDPATSESMTRRFYLNQVVKGTSQWLSPARFTALAVKATVSRRREPIALGFDGSVRLDSTALVGCRGSDGFLWPIAVWERPKGAPRDWEVPFVEVDDKVRETLEDFDVRWMYADPAYWQDIVGRWSLDYADVVYEFWTHRRALMARAVERFETAVLNGQLSYSGLEVHEVLPRHILNAVAEDTPSGKIIRKEFPQSDRKIDCGMAAILAYEARAAAVQDGRFDDDKNGELFSF